MSAANEGRGNSGGLLPGVSARQAGAVESEAEELQRSAEILETEQQSLLETSSVESDYQSALAAFVEAKHDQVERIEGRLEDVIGQQEAKLHRIEANRPGFLSLPVTRAGWQSQLEQQQSLLQKLHGRLETVREVKEGMGLHSPKIEELAMRKLRFHERELTQEWDEFRAAQRGHQELMRRREQEQRKQNQRLGEVLGSSSMVLGHSLGVPRSSN